MTKAKIVRRWFTIEHICANRDSLPFLTEKEARTAFANIQKIQGTYRLIEHTETRRIVK